MALGIAGATDEDVWSLDSRGILTLVVGKETYETLGLVGEALPWKEHAETHGMYRACVLASMSNSPSVASSDSHISSRLPSFRRQHENMACIWA